MITLNKVHETNHLLAELYKLVTKGHFIMDVLDIVDMAANLLS